MKRYIILFAEYRVLTTTKIENDCETGLLFRVSGRGSKRLKDYILLSACGYDD